jgi:hypothetical protein
LEDHCDGHKGIPPYLHDSGGSRGRQHGHVNGKATKAELEDENGKLVYGVEVLAGGNATDVKVDINSAQVLSAQADRGDNEGHEDERKGERDKD